MTGKRHPPDPTAPLNAPGRVGTDQPSVTGPELPADVCAMLRKGAPRMVHTPCCARDAYRALDGAQDGARRAGAVRGDGRVARRRLPARPGRRRAAARAQPARRRPVAAGACPPPCPPPRPCTVVAGPVTRRDVVPGGHTCVVCRDLPVRPFDAADVDPSVEYRPARPGAGPARRPRPRRCTAHERARARAIRARGRDVRRARVYGLPADLALALWTLQGSRGVRAGGRPARPRPPGCTSTTTTTSPPSTATRSRKAARTASPGSCASSAPGHRGPADSALDAGARGRSAAAARRSPRRPADGLAPASPRRQGAAVVRTPSTITDRGDVQAPVSTNREYAGVRTSVQRARP
jgi:hypothetical protein